MQPKHISSTTNKTVREAARLKRKRHRYEARRFLAEGEDLLDAALARGVAPRQVFVLEGYEEDLLPRLEDAAGARPGRAAVEIETYTCSASVLEKLSELGSGSRVVAVFEMLDLKFHGNITADVAPGLPVLYLAGAGDPGNVGSLIRSAAALGAAAAVAGPGTADPYAPKSLRATMGAVFQIPLYLTVNPETIVSWCDREGIPLICTDVHAGDPVWKAALEGSFLVVMGPERESIPRRISDAASQTVRIPLAGETESLNVAMAGTVILYEALRQRSPGRQ